MKNVFIIVDKQNNNNNKMYFLEQEWSYFRKNSNLCNLTTLFSVSVLIVKSKLKQPRRTRLVVGKQMFYR